MVAYNRDVPDAPNNPSVDQPKMKTNTNSIDTLIAIDHISFNATNGGQHKAITFNQDFSYVPVPPVSPPQLFTDTVAPSSKPELYYYSGDATNSSTQYANAASGSVFLFGGMILKWGTGTANSAGTVNNFAPAFPNACYVVIPTQLTVAPVIISAISASSFTASRNAIGVSNINYIAIGY